MSQLFISPFVPALSTTGTILSGAKLAFYRSGTLTLETVYTDADLTVPHDQSANGSGTVGVEADATGRFPSIYLDPAVSYRVKAMTAAGVLLPEGDVDPYGESPGSAATTLLATYYGVDPEDATSDQTVAWQAAMDAASAMFVTTGKIIELIGPKATTRVANLIPKPGVLLNLNWGTLKRTDATSHGDFRCVLYANATSAGYTVDAAVRDLIPFHFGVINGTLDGNASYAAPWLWTFASFPISNPGSGYNAVPTVTIDGVVREGTATKPVPTAVTLQAYLGLDPSASHVIAAGGTNYVVGDEITLDAGGGTIFNGTAPKLRVTGVSAGAVTTFEVVESGAFSALPSGNMLHASVRQYIDQKAVTGSARSGFQLTAAANGWYVVHIGVLSQGDYYFMEDFPENGGPAVVTIAGGTSGTTATASIIGSGSYDDGHGHRTEHSAGWYLRALVTSGACDFLFKVHARNLHIANCTGDGIYIGGGTDNDFAAMSSHNCFRGGVTTVAMAYTSIDGWDATGYGLGFNTELSGGTHLTDTTKARTPHSGNTLIVAAGTNYAIGDIVWATGGRYSKPAKWQVGKVTAGVIDTLMLIDPGSYSQFPSGTVATATDSVSGSGLTLTPLAGDTYSRVTVNNFHAKTRGGNVFNFVHGRWRFTNCSFGWGSDRGRNVFQTSTGGDVDAVLDQCSFEGHTSPGVELATLIPRRLTFIEPRIRNRVQSRGVVPPIAQMGGDQYAAISMANGSGGITIPDARVVMVRPKIECEQANRNLDLFAIIMAATANNATREYTYRLKLVDPEWIGTFMTWRVRSDRGGLLEIEGGDMGPARGGGISFVTAATTTETMVRITGMPKRGGAAELVSGTCSGSPTADKRFGFAVNSTIDEADNLWSAAGFTGGSAIRLDMSQCVVMSDSIPSAATNKGGIIGMRWQVRGETGYWRCTATSNTAATWVGDLSGSATWDPASIADGAQETKAVTVTGAALGDFLERISFTNSLGGLVLSGYVSATDTVTAVLTNASGGAVDLASGTVKAVVRKA